MSTKRILYLCTGNSCRSQMAEGWTRHLKSGVLEPASAGIEPSIVDPRAIQVMAEVGVDLTGQSSKHLDDVMETGFDFVVTVCSDAAEACPIFRGDALVVHQPFDDPPRLAKPGDSEEAILTQYRRVRDELRAYVESLPEALMG